MNKPIRKAVLPVAGLGTRFLPATKAIPKEMLTVVDRPILQHVVDEARAAGIEQFIFVTGRNKGVIEDHFDIAYELDDTLQRRGKLQQIRGVEGRPAAGGRDELHPPAGAARARPRRVVRARPRRRRAVRAAAARHGHDGGARAAADASPSASKSTSASAATSSRSRRFLPTKPISTASSAVGEDDGHAFEITGMVEKPKKGTAPSNLIISGRYMLQPEIFEILEPVEKGIGGEIQLTDGMIELANASSSMACASTGAPTTAARSSAFSPPTSLSRSMRSDLLRASWSELKKLGRRSGRRRGSALQLEADHENVGDVIGIRPVRRRRAGGWRSPSARGRARLYSARSPKVVVESRCGTPT